MYFLFVFLKVILFFKILGYGVVPFPSSHRWLCGGSQLNLTAVSGIEEKAIRILNILLN